MKKQKQVYSFVTLLVVLFIALIGARIWSDEQPGDYDQFAQCIADSGATFYGAFWCPHCNEQKELFGNSAQYLPYVECSKEDRSGQLDVCIEAGIEGYPTWEFADDSRLSGSLSFDVLSTKTGCQLDGSTMPAVTIDGTVVEASSTINLGTLPVTPITE